MSLPKESFTLDRVMGIHQLQLLKEHIQLKPKDAVLDVGCGIGRTAFALTKYINTEGSMKASMLWSWV